MIRTILASLAALCLASAAVAAPSAASAEKPCPAGVGKAVCCKASVADHCMYVSCCEHGNKAFFTQNGCSTCAKNTAKAQLAHHSASAKCENAYVSCCEQGNGAFFKKHSCNMCAAAGGKTACCGGEAKKK